MEPKIKSRGRPPRFDRDTALQTATEVFWRHGYEGASIALLTERMGVTPPTLYAAFGSKAELHRQVLARHRALREKQAAPQGDSAVSLRRVLEAHLREAVRRFTDPSGPRGCIVAVGSLQCGLENSHAGRLAASERIADLEDFMRRLEHAVATGELPANTNVAALARFYAAVHQGMAVQAIDGAAASDLDAVVDLALAAWPGRRPGERPEPLQQPTAERPSHAASGLPEGSPG